MTGPPATQRDVAPLSRARPAMTAATAANRRWSDLVPVPGARPGDWVDWGRLLGRAPVMEVRDRTTVGVVLRAGHVPPPLQALGN